MGRHAQQYRQCVADRLRLELLVLPVEKLILVCNQPLLLEQIVEGVFDVRFEAVAALLYGDIGAVLGNPEQSR